MTEPQVYGKRSARRRVLGSMREAGSCVALARLSPLLASTSGVKMGELGTSAEGMTLVGATLEGFYSMPTTFVASFETIESTFDVEVNGVRLTLSFPTIRWRSDGTPLVERPRFTETSEDAWQYREPQWGRVTRYSRNFSHADIRVTAIRIFINDEAQTQTEYNRLKAALQGGLRDWWSRVNSWIECDHFQDTAMGWGSRADDPSAGLDLWGRRPEGYDNSVPTPSSIVTIYGTETDGISPADFESVLAKAEDPSAQPDLPLRLLASARAASMGHDSRVCVIDVGSAAETAATDFVASKLSCEHALDESQIDRILLGSKGLSKRIELARVFGLEVPGGFQQAVTELRNRASHAGESISIEEARKALRFTEAVVLQQCPLLTRSG